MPLLLTVPFINTFFYQFYTLLVIVHRTCNLLFKALFIRFSISHYFLAIFLPFRYPGYRPSPFCNAFSKILFVLYIFRYKKFQKLSPTFIKNWWSHFPLNCQSKFQSLYRACGRKVGLCNA